MNRPYSPYSTSRDTHSEPGPYPGYRADRESRYAPDYPAHQTGYAPDHDTAYADHDTAYAAGYNAPSDYTDFPTGPEPDYSEYEFPADYHEPLDRRWIWVAGVAGAILMIAVICTGVILGGGDSGTVSATTSSAEPVQDAAPAPSLAVPPAGAMPETITTVTPTLPAPIEPAPAAEVPAAPIPAAPEPMPGAIPDANIDPAVAARTITYQVSGNRQLIDFVTVIYTDQQGALRTDVNVALPWVKSVTLDPGVELSSVTATSVGGQLNCSIIDGTGAALAVQANNTMIATCTK